ncbi:MAG: hypothetical protein R2880_18495 [Deinococcales bacterium]
MTLNLPKNYQSIKQLDLDSNPQLLSLVPEAFALSDPILSQGLNLRAYKLYSHAFFWQVE